MGTNMRQTLLAAALVTMLTGCAFNRYVEHKADGSWVKNTTGALFTKGGVKGLTVANKTAQTSTGLKIVDAVGATDSEGIAAAGAAFGQAAGEAFKKAVVP